METDQKANQMKPCDKCKTRLGCREAGRCINESSPDVKPMGAVTICRNGYIQELERDRDRWKAAHDNQVELKRIIAARPDLKGRAPMVETLMSQRDQLAEALKEIHYGHTDKAESMAIAALAYLENDKPFIYHSRHGSIYTSERCDLRTGIDVEGYPQRQDLAMRDTAEMVAYHALNIYPELNGFSGYYTLRFHYQNA